MYLWIWNPATDELRSGYNHRGPCPDGCLFLCASSEAKARGEAVRARAAGLA